jgi:hypothetical protein
MGGAPSKSGGAPQAIVFPKCPTPFESAGNLSCVMQCPADKGFERLPSNGGFKCVYKSDSSLFVPLTTLSATMFNGTTLENLKTADAKAYSEFVKEKDRVNNELSILYANMDKNSKLNDAFKLLQSAENARDTAPNAYQQARTLYYTLLKGDAWKEEEKSRVSKAEVDPLVKKYKSSRDAALNQYHNQRKTVEVVTGLKDKVLSLKDEFKYSVDTFTKQLGNVKSAINMERRDRQTETIVSPWSWFDVILNIAIVGSLIYAAVSIYPKVFRPTPAITQPIVMMR